MSAQTGAHMTESSGMADDDWKRDLFLIAEQQDKAAFARLFDQFAPRLRGWLIGQGAAPEEADEVAQDTMVKVWQKAKQFDPARASAQAWIFAIARNRRIDLIRQRQVRTRTADNFAKEFDAHHEAPAQPDQHVEQSGIKAIVGRSLKELPPQQLEVIRLSYFEGLSHREIAEKLGLPVGTVKSRIRLAFSRLKDNLADTDLVLQD